MDMFLPRARSRFRSGLSAIALGTIGCLVLSAQSLAHERQVAPRAATQQAAKRPLNVVFIVADDLRQGGAFGSTEVRTPNLDRLAARGVSFRQAYNQYPLCGPSRASFLTGLRPNTTRIYDLQTTVRSAVPDVVTMPQYFRQNGYFSARVGKMYHQGVPGGVGKPIETDRHDDPASWDAAFNPKGHDKDVEGPDMLTNLTPKIPMGVAIAYRADDAPDDAQTDGIVATKVIDLIEANKDRPFFIAAGFYRPHVPEIVPTRYFDLYPDIAFKPEPRERVASLVPAARGPSYRYVSEPAQGLTPEQQRDFVRSYYAATSFMDAQVGRILDALDRSGVADRTIMVFTSDHGFNLGEHGLWQKQNLTDHSTRVPLIIAMPGQRRRHRISSSIVELVDLYPTLAELAGLPAPRRVDGRSLRPLIAGRGSVQWNFPAQSQVADGRSVRFGNWRYTEYGPDGAKGVELFDLKRDPGEYRNLASQSRYRSVIARLKPMLPGDPPPSIAPKLPFGD